MQEAGPTIKIYVNIIVKTCNMQIISRTTYHIALFWSKQGCSEWRNCRTPGTQPWWQINGTLPPLHEMYTVYYTYPLHIAYCMSVNVHAIYACGFAWLAPVGIEAFITTVRLLIWSALETPEQAKFDFCVLCIFHSNLYTIGSSYDISYIPKVDKMLAQ